MVHVWEILQVWHVMEKISRENVSNFQFSKPFILVAEDDGICEVSVEKFSWGMNSAVFVVEPSVRVFHGNQLKV